MARRRAAKGRRWRRIVGLAAPHWRQFILVALFSLLAAGMDLVSPIIYREAVNDIAGLFVGQPGSTGIEIFRSRMHSTAPQPAVQPIPAPAAREPHRRGHVAPRTVEQVMSTLLWAVTLLFIFNVFSQYWSLVADQRTVKLASRIEADVIQRTFSHVLQLPLRFFSRRSSGTIAKQIDQSDQVAPVISAIAHEVGPELITMVGALAIMFTQSWRLSLAALITVPPYVAVAWLSSRRLETGLTQYYEMWDRVSARIQDALGAVKTVKLAGSEARESERLRSISETAYDTYVERNRLANRYVFLQNSLNYLAQALVLGFGGWLVFERELTPGDVVMFVAYLDRLYSPVESLTGLSVSLQENFASLRRAEKLQSVAVESAAGKPLRPGPGQVEFRGVCFSYTAGREVLHKVSFVAEAGAVTAIVGPSGAGKTTAADLLLKLYEPSAGDILIDGQSIRHIAPSDVRRELSVVAADGAIFPGTLADNLRYQRPEASDAEVMAAVKAAGLDPMIERLPDGLATEIGEHGVGLSVGERQRLQIARSLVVRPRILVLDEATANLDYATETEVRQAILAAPDRPTMLIISHRYSMVEKADHVVVLDAGKVVAKGHPAELIARGGWFADFARSGSVEH